MRNLIRKIFILAVIFVMVCGLASADPSIKFDNLTIDLGEITESVKISTEFKFTNVGDKTLECLDVRNWGLEVRARLKPRHRLYASTIPLQK
jgi:hypothetical protein